MSDNINFYNYYLSETAVKITMLNLAEKRMQKNTYMHNDYIIQGLFWDNVHNHNTREFHLHLQGLRRMF